MNQSKIKQFHIVYLFAIFYVICPHYFRIFGIAMRDLILCGSFALMFATNPRFTIQIKKNCIVLSMALVIWGFFVAGVQIYHGEIFEAVKHLVLWLGIPFLAIRAIDTKEKFLLIIDGLVIVSLIVGFFGIVEEIFRFDIFHILNTIGATISYNPLRLGLLRIISFTSHAISYCCFCMLMLALIFYRYQVKKGKLYIIAYIVMLLNAFLTLSRSSLVGLIISQFLLMWYCGNRRFLKKIIPIAIFGLFAGVLFCVGVPAILDKLRILIYMVLAIFDETYVPLLQQAGFTDNAGGIGNRFDLYYWVYDALGKNFWVGEGTWANFAYRYWNDYGYYTVKTSIEVEWLNTMYKHGFIGMLAEIIFYCVYMAKAFSSTYKRPREWEGRISFSRTIGTLIFSYVIVLFATMQNEEGQLFAVIFVLFFAYVFHGGYSDIGGQLFNTGKND